MAWSDERCRYHAHVGALREQSSFHGYLRLQPQRSRRARLSAAAPGTQCRSATRSRAGAARPGRLRL
jgi:hypothetical protein